MTDKYFPYNKIIEEMEERTKSCNIKILDSLRYFLRQSQGEYGPSQAVTLSDETTKKIDELIYEFKKDCYCGNANSIIWGDHSSYTKQDIHIKKKKQES
jgi:hypothetical protein